MKTSHVTVKASVNNSKSMYRRTLSLFFCFLVAIGAMMGVVSCQSVERKPHRYLITDGYVGWTRIDFSVSGEPEIIFEDPFLVFQIPDSGRLKTSSPPIFGAASDEYYYYSGHTLRRLPVTRSGRGGMIWGGFTGSSDDGKNKDFYEYFFVGTEQQFEVFGKPGLSAGARPQVGDVRRIEKPY